MTLSVTEEGSGRALLLLHAYPLSAQMWAAQREGLADVARVITPDLPGFGSSPLSSAEPSLDAVAADLAALLTERDLTDVVLGGLSAGGYVALAALRRADVRTRVGGLVLADTRASADSEQAAADRGRIAEQVLARGSALLVDELLPNLIGRSTARHHPLIAGRIRSMVEAASPQAVAWLSRAMARRADTFDVLDAFDSPALVIVGEEDVITPAGDAAAMAARLSDVRLQHIAHAGHIAAMEAPEAFNVALRRFLVELPAAS